MAKYVEKQKNGDEVIRWERKEKLSREEKQKQWREAEAEVKKGKAICLTDLI